MHSSINIIGLQNYRPLQETIWDGWVPATFNSDVIEDLNSFNNSVPHKYAELLYDRICFLVSKFCIMISSSRI